MMDLIEKLVAEVGVARERVLGLTAVIVVPGAAAGEWTVAEIVEHLVLAEMSGVAKICQAAEATRAGAGFAGENPNRGLRIEEIVARTWKPREIAPPIATPHMAGTLGYWRAALRGCQGELSAVVEALEGLDPREVIFPHFLCGPLDAVQRLEFLRFHLDRHADKIEEIRGGL